MNEIKDDIYDIYDIWNESIFVQKWAWLFLFLLGIVILFISYIIYIYVYKKPKKIDPLLIIQNRWLDIDTLVIKTVEDSKNFYYKVSQLIKLYINYVLHQSVDGLTDYELLQWSQSHLDEKQEAILKNIFQHASMMKFEHQVAHDQQIEDIKKLVQDFMHSFKEI